jgi:hypothetical protein
MLKYAVALTAFLATSVTLAEEIPQGGMLLPINTQCTNPSTEMTDMVTTKYAEVAFAEGQAMVQYQRTGEWVAVPFTLYVNPKQLTWSMVAFMPSGPGCLISSGEGFIPAINTTY